MGPVLDEPFRAVAQPLVPQLPDVGGELSFLPLFGVQLGDGVLVGGPGYCNLFFKGVVLLFHAVRLLETRE